MQTNLNYLSTRQDVLAQNVANANTPGYSAKDVQPLDFKKVFRSVDRSVVLNATNPSHLSPQVKAGAHGVSEISNTEAFEISPTGNKVVLEQEVLKVARNSAEYQKTTNLYRKMFEMLKSAIGDRQ